MGMTRDRKRWEILEDTGMNEKGGKPEGEYEWMRKDGREGRWK